MSPCCLCNGTGTSQGCPCCGRRLPPDPVAVALETARRRLEHRFQVPGLVLRGNRAMLWVGGEIVAEAVAGSPLAAIEALMMTVAGMCSCGRRNDWQALPVLGEQTMPWGERLELRNCPCGSTLSLVLEDGDFDAWEFADGEHCPDLVVETLGIGRRVA